MRPEERVLRRNKRFVLRKEKDGCILTDPSVEGYATLNPTGTLVWKLLNGKNSLKEIIEKATKAYGISKNKAKKDITEFVKGLRKSRLLSILPPGNVHFAITGRCNLRCKHCLAKETWEMKDISTGKMLNIIDQMADAGVRSVALFGGEPLLKKDIFTLIDRLKKHNIVIIVNTNATLITEKMADEFKKRDVTSFIVSLDGASPHVHDIQRGKGSFQKTIKGLKVLVSKNLFVLISFIVTKINESDIEKVAALCRKLKVNQVRYNHVFYTGNVACYEKNVFIAPRDDVKNCERIFKLRQKYGDFITGSYLQQYEKLQRVGKVLAEKEKITVLPCVAAQDDCLIRPDGWVTPCAIMWEVKAGNLLKESFVDIWEDSKVMNSFRKTKYIDIKKIPECRECEYQFLCFQGHRCYPYYYPGGIKDKRLYCFK